MSASPSVLANVGALSPYVLVAEYDLQRAAIYGQLINDEGLEAIVCRDGNEAKAVLERRGPPSVVVLDLSLPGRDGFAVLSDLRAAVAPEECAALVISASEAMRSTAWAMREKLGIESVLPRDASWTLLRTTLSSAIKRAHRDDSTTGASTPPQNTLRRIVAAASQAFDVPITVAYAKLAHRDLFTAHLSLEGPVPGLELSQQWAFVQQVLAAGEPLIVPDAREHPFFRDEAVVRRGGIRGFVGVPIVNASGVTFGVLCLVDIKVMTFGVHDLDALRAFGRRVGGDMERRVDAGRTGNSHVDELSDLSRIALTDPLTGLANRRGGEKSIAREISRARRHSSPLSVMILDIDNFKVINDTHGHAAGDKALREVSRTVSEVVRGSDLAVRWGGDEIMLVLPGVTTEGARILAERVRARVEALQLPGVSAITISAGVAEVTGAQPFEEVLALADSRLYAAKAAGRNRVA